MKNLSLYLLITAAGATAALAGGCSKHSKAENDPEIPEINVAVPLVDSIVLHKTYPGLLMANNSIDIVCRVNGTLQSSNYEAGQFVQKGQVLFTIESTQYRDAVKRAEAALATAKSQLDYASRNYDALSEALKSDAVSQIEVIQAKSQMEQAAASVKDSEAALSLARLNLSYCTITAPMSGYVSNGAFSVGSVINGAGAPVTLATLYDNTQMLAQFHIEDAQYEQMLGQTGISNRSLYSKVPLKFTQDLPHTYTTELYYESPSVNSSTGTLELRGRIDNPYNELKNGMYVTVELPYGINPKAILIKDASIGTDQLGKYVYLVNDSNKIVYTPIKTGELYRDSLRVVNEGIKPGDRYVTEALLTVRNGMEVKPHLQK